MIYLLTNISVKGAMPQIVPSTFMSSILCTLIIAIHTKKTWLKPNLNIVVALILDLKSALSGRIYLTTNSGKTF